MQKNEQHSTHAPDNLNQIVRTSLAGSVYETLLEAIVTGRVAGGTAVSEVKLARQFQISRTPVHEAVVRLVGDGLIEQSGARSHRPRVACFGTDDIVELYGMRRLLESSAAESAALRLSDEAIEALKRGADALADSFSAVDWAERAIAFDMRFHEIVASAAGSRRLGEDIRRYRRLVRGFCRISGTLSNLREAWREHLRIIEAIAARRPLAARDAMAAHVDARLHALLPLLKGCGIDAVADDPPAPLAKNFSVARSVSSLP